MHWYFSLRSPYSWLAHHDLLHRYPETAARVEWRMFFEPDDQSLTALRSARGDFPYVAMSRAKHFYILQDVRRLAADRGLEVAWPIDRQPRWEVPHLAYLVAADAGRGREFIDAVYRARWQQGRDICDPATMASLAADLSLDPKMLTGAAEDPERRAAGVRALLAVHRDGVFGVPFFVAGREKFWGIDRLPAFVAATAVVPSDVAEPPAEPHRASMGADQGHAGGCG
ncbi:2-hydroxychromene-2-carboxylate isomerase [Micromonospora sp. NPDC005203]|uniref:2-hydroxychromene-2-carboxylate isomerase n=1 Tax=Micromonospora sp. NPDC005203 TaxID=3364226 RepID=UPI0036918807